MTTPKSGLSRELIARTALALTDELGLGGLSMRKLGNELGVEAMSLYHYVTNKDDLLDAMLDCLFTEIQLPVDVPEQDWETAVRQGFGSFHDVLVAHAAAPELFATRPARSQVGLEVLMFSFGRLTAVGIEDHLACHAIHTLTSFTMGHVAAELGTMAVNRETGGLDPASLDDEQLAHFVSTRQTFTSGAMFDAGLDFVIAGLRSLCELP